MENIKFCQSCSMPLTDPSLAGTESDGSPASDYCRYCYRHGQFTHPDMSMDDMRSMIIEKMEKENLPEDIIETAVKRLASLKRWKTSGRNTFLQRPKNIKT
jgi:hypothetical protein